VQQNEGHNDVYQRSAVQNQIGLHARPATFLYKMPMSVKVFHRVVKEERRVNAKSLLGVLSLGIVGGTIIKSLRRNDEQNAVVAWSSSWNRFCRKRICYELKRVPQRRHAFLLFRRIAFEGRKAYAIIN
jgi:phosphocarrier protein